MKPTIPTTTPQLPKGKNESRPLTSAVMDYIRELIDNSEGKLTRTMLAKDIGVPLCSISEWLLKWRATPRAEALLELMAWTLKKDPEAFPIFLQKLAGKN